MAVHDPPFLIVGYISKPHGMRGEVLVRLLTDHPDRSFLPGHHFHVADETGEAPDGGPALTLAASRPHQGGLLVRFLGVEDREAADRLRGRYLMRAFEDAVPVEEGEVFYHQLLGMRVRTRDGVEVGEVVEVYELEPADLLEVKRPGGLTLVPFRKEIVLLVNLAAREIVIDPPEGLLEL